MRTYNAREPTAEDIKALADELKKLDFDEKTAYVIAVECYSQAKDAVEQLVTASIKLDFLKKFYNTKE